VRVHVVDPSAYTPPYDHALCRALAAAGAQVTLVTSRFAHGAVAPADGYLRRELFYPAALRWSGRSSLARDARRLVKLAEHVPDMLRYRRAAREAQVVHFQWLALQQLDARLLPPRRSPAGARRPLVLTAHDILPREPRPGQLAAQRRLYGRVDAVVVHSHSGRARLLGLGVAPERVHVIPHGVLRPWEDTIRGAGAGSSAGAGAGRGAAVEGERAPRLPPELAADGDTRVALFVGLLRPYKGLAELIEAWRGLGGELGGAELWIVGMPRMDLRPLRAETSRCTETGAGQVRLLERFVSDEELHALMLRAELVVLPYRQIDHSGVAFTALGAGVPLLLSDVGGFPEIARTGAARTVAAGDVSALGGALRQLLGDRQTLRAMAERARTAAAGPYAWQGIAERTLGLYEQLLRENPGG
jgi:glycosyltransferase involved in cell wall biosynthesis